LKENLDTLSASNARLEDENRQLRQLLEQHGASWPDSRSVGHLTRLPESSAQVLNPSTLQAENMTTSPMPIQAGSQIQAGEDTQGGIDYEQLGIDFVLGFEKPCLRHMGAHSAERPDELYGHALMASCYPGIYPESTDDMPFDSASNSTSGQEEWTLSKSSFASLLHHSERRNLDGEFTPVMVWHMVLEHPRFSEFTLEDFERLRQDLGGKVRCYGFGAMFEEFEVRDIIDSFMWSKDIF
jgi:hypothetical protein